MKKLLTVRAVAEAAVGVALLIHDDGARDWHCPDRTWGHLLAGNAAARHVDLQHPRHALPLYLGVRSEWVGPLLWPAVVLHLVLTFLLARAWRNANKN